MKLCKRCYINKSIESFYIHRGMKDGYLNICKECTRERVIKNRQKNIEYYRNYDRSRSAEPHRKKDRKEYAEKNKELMKIIKSNWAKRNKHKKNAMLRVYRAIQSGKLMKKICEVCGSEKSEAHHSDYNKPYDVLWLCDQHHKEEHKRIRNEIRSTKRPPD